MKLCTEHRKLNVTTCAERVSRFAMVIRNEASKSKPVIQAWIQRLATLTASAHQSITFDRGTAFSAWRHLKVATEADA